MWIRVCNGNAKVNTDAVTDKNTDEIVAFKVPKELIEAKAKF